MKRGSYREKDLSDLRTKTYRMRVSGSELKKLGMSKSGAIFKAIDYYEEIVYGKREDEQSYL